LRLLVEQQLRAELGSLMTSGNLKHSESYLKHS
jgi:hypothetical protein